MPNINAIKNKLFNKIRLKKIIQQNILVFFILTILLCSMLYFENSIIFFGNIGFYILTLIIWYCEYLIFKGITNKSNLSISLVIAIEAIIDILNYIVRTVRGSCITISDLYAIQTALSVSKNIKFTFDLNFLFGIFSIISSIIILIIYRKTIIESKTSLPIRFSKILIGVTIIFLLSLTNIYNNQSLWDVNETYRTLGTPISILRMIHNSVVQPPKNYNKKEIQEIIKKYNTSANDTNSDMANIIVIINESFCDYYNLYQQGTSNPIEYFTELSHSENVISGTMYSSTFGGQTANVEYEFLTQNSLRILPVGSYVFQQYISKPIKSSLVQNLKIQGYNTSAIHPWENYAYSRNKIYPFFGFDSIKFKDDIDGLEQTFNNHFYTDKSTYKELLKEIKNKDKNEKIFKYVLTVQNHTGYINPDPTQITYSNELSQNVYMQLIHDSSEALRDVIAELKSLDEKYILLFFGDHQPNLDRQDNSFEMDMKEYEVPFIIWANYDIEEQYNIQTSTIYLQNYLLKSANVPFSAQNNYMEELKKYYPIITQNFYIDSTGKIFKENDDTSKNYQKLEEYYKIDYYEIFDNK